MRQVHPIGPAPDFSDIRIGSAGLKYVIDITVKVKSLSAHINPINVYDMKYNVRCGFYLDAANMRAYHSLVTSIHCAFIIIKAK